MDKDLIRNLLKLADTQYVLLNHPIGYPNREAKLQESSEGGM